MSISAKKSISQPPFEIFFVTTQVRVLLTSFEDLPLTYVCITEGTAILKELIQNADDAGARRVCLTLDKRSHSAVRVADPNLAAFQGPALLVYNDAVFTKSDFQSIQRIGDSLKRAEEEAKSKIGRFGIGFNAVYHWTDLPSFVSLNYLVMLDPQARFLPNVNPANPGLY